MSQNTFLWEVSFWNFLFVTVILFGGAAYLTGRAVAREWQPDANLVVYMIFLAMAARFIHFALYNGTLLSPYYYALDLVVLMGMALLGRRVTRAKQMTTQYSFIYRRTGPLTWTKKP